MRAPFASLFLAAVLTSPVVAQQPAGGSVLWLVEPAGRLDPAGQTTGTLSSSDFYGPNDIYIDVWELDGSAGASVTLDLVSDDFDPVLFVVGPGLAETLWDDDSGGNCNARVTLRFLESGTYRVAATTTSSRTTGVYTLTASANAGAASIVPCGGPDPAMFVSLPVAGTITPAPEPVSGSLNAGDPVLEDGTLADVWEIAGEAGRTVTILLESDAFDSYLYVTGPGVGGVITDDDGGGDLHSRLVFTFPSTGTYRIIASSVSSGSTGPYRLTVTQ